MQGTTIDILANEIISNIMSYLNLTDIYKLSRCINNIL